MTVPLNPQKPQAEDEAPEDDQLVQYPETPIELAKDIYTPDRSNKREKSIYHTGTILKDSVLANYDKQDQQLIMLFHELESLFISKKMYHTARMYNAMKQEYIGTTRGLGGFERKNINTSRQVSEYSMPRTSEDVLNRAVPRRKENENED